MAQDAGCARVAQRPFGQGVPLQSQSQVVVRVESGWVPGLVLRVSQDGQTVLVTYELEGRVSTSWLSTEGVRLSE
ncbi:hypothetical protein ASE01_09950 [Nocardioides sp. Root190]|nr:hypothetical protein ASE01_09950 [Nocardioides sp. Root190]